MSADTYKVIYDKELGQLQQPVKNRERFRVNVVAFGTNNDITEQAELEKFKLNLYEDFIDTCGDIYIQTFEYWADKNVQRRGRHAL